MLLNILRISASNVLKMAVSNMIVIYGIGSADDIFHSYKPTGNTSTLSLNWPLLWSAR